MHSSPRILSKKDCHKTMAVFFIFFFQTAGQASIINSQNLSCRNPVRSLTFSICKIIYMPLKKDYNNQKFQKPFYQIAEYHSDRNKKEGKSNYTLQTTSPPKKDFTYHYKICKVFFFYVCFIPLPVSMLLLPPVQSALLPLSFPS